MAETNKPLVLTITRSKQSRQFILRKGGKFTVGQNGNNDLILYGTEYPKQHTLFSQKNGSYLINIKPFISGEVTLDKSTLYISDLVKHDILPAKHNSYLLKLSPSKNGVINVGDTKIEFSFQHVARKRAPVAYRTPEYSWLRATTKSLASDLLFKFIFIFVLTLNVLLIYGLKDYKVNIAKKFDFERMPERLAKFIVKPPEELFADESSTSGVNIENAENADKSSSESNNRESNRERNNRQRSGSGRGNPAASAGLFSLIGGTGASSKTSSIVDALVDKGLITQLDDILSGGTNLKVGKNNTKDKTDPFDQLIGTGGTGGIDDFLNDMTENVVPQVTLKKKAKVDLIRPQKVAGSTEALGQRSDQSIMNVVLSRKGEIQYIFEKYLKRNPNLRGKISIEFTIAANGFVKSAKVIDATINLPQFQRELLGSIKRMKFPAISSGEVTTVFPFQFSPQL